MIAGIAAAFGLQQIGQLVGGQRVGLDARAVPAASLRVPGGLNRVGGGWEWQY